ncbi:hypothetical protein BV25DRAFT_1919217 [Artomyces pyxidatus]|uniref:Uncharacterized protein n=1 Tax=Artomyces pyxidatus TaxID=48021 RepID=A0ACB8SRV7_9AGAM|nr:hypothetical protein BV25DRAFT_1919217 [Artomyces pyxidatus]
MSSTKSNPSRGGAASSSRTTSSTPRRPRGPDSPRLTTPWSIWSLYSKHGAAPTAREHPAFPKARVPPSAAFIFTREPLFRQAEGRGRRPGSQPSRRVRETWPPVDDAVWGGDQENVGMVVIEDRRCSLMELMASDGYFHDLGPGDQEDEGYQRDDRWSTVRVFESPSQNSLNVERLTTLDPLVDSTARARRFHLEQPIRSCHPESPAKTAGGSGAVHSQSLVLELSTAHHLAQRGPLFDNSLRQVMRACVIDLGRKPVGRTAEWKGPTSPLSCNDCYEISELLAALDSVSAWPARKEDESTSSRSCAVCRA